MYHDEHEFTLRAPAEKRREPIVTKRKCSEQVMKKARQRIRPTQICENRDAPKMEFWSGAVDRSATAPRTPPGPPPQAAERQQRTWPAGERRGPPRPTAPAGERTVGYE